LTVPYQAKISAWFTVAAALNVAPFFERYRSHSPHMRKRAAPRISIARAFTGRPAVMIVVASLMGALSPFCSCGVHSGHRGAAGERRAARAGHGILARLAADGPVDVRHHGGRSRRPVRGAKTLAAIGVGLLGGFGVLALQECGALTGSPLRDTRAMAAAPGRKSQPKSCRLAAHGTRRSAAKPFLKSAAQNALFPRQVALCSPSTLESLMVAYVPSDLVTRIAGDGSLLQSLVRRWSAFQAISTATPRCRW
jgi:hypothetical protein